MQQTLSIKQHAAESIIKLHCLTVCIGGGVALLYLPYIQHVTHQRGDIDILGDALLPVVCIPVRAIVTDGVLAHIFAEPHQYRRGERLSRVYLVVGSITVSAGVKGTDPLYHLAAPLSGKSSQQQYSAVTIPRSGCTNMSGWLG